MEHDNGAGVLSDNAVVEISLDIKKASLTNQQVEITLENRLAREGYARAYKHTNNLYLIYAGYQDYNSFLRTKTEN